MSINDHRAPLVLLAAGIGSRFGGIKPVAPVGPAGEPLAVIALQQARQAGFTEAVVIVSDRTEQAVRAALEPGLSGSSGAVLPGIDVRFARQEVPEGRSKPLGTVDAVLAAGVRGDCVVANGDDLYGVAGLARARAWLAAQETGPVAPGGPAAAAAVLYRVEATLPDSGGVSRAVPVVDGAGRLLALEERREVHRTADGTIRDAQDRVIAAGTPVSMNLWCLRAAALDRLAAAFEVFRAAAPADGELGLPDAIGGLVQHGLAVDALVTDSTWHGVTWPGDVAVVRAALTAAAGR